jgi:hypothetical protein
MYSDLLTQGLMSVLMSLDAAVAPLSSAPEKQRALPAVMDRTYVHNDPDSGRFTSNACGVVIRPTRQSHVWQKLPM